MDDDNRNGSSLPPEFVDASGEFYYQQSQVEKKLVPGLKNLYPKLFRRHATPEEMPALRALGMIPSFQKSGQVLTLVKKSEIQDLLEGRTEKYKAVPRSKKLLIGAGSHTEELKKPPFTNIQLVSQALLDSENSGLTAREVADWVSNLYPYYQSVEKFKLKRASDVLSKSKFFTQKHSRMWYIVQKYETQLRMSAYLCRPKTMLEKRQKSKRLTMGENSSTTFGPLQPRSMLAAQALESTAESSEVKCVASYPMNTTIHEQENQPVQAGTSSIQMDQDERSQLDVAIGNPSNPQETIPDVLSTISAVENGAMTSNYTSSPYKIDEPKISFDDIIDLTSDELEDQLEWKFNPIRSPTTTDSINPDAGIVELQCPLCDTKFPTKEALGEHVVTHGKAPPTHVTETVRKALQSVAPSLFNNRNPEATIIVFSGNVYLGSSNTSAS